MRLDRCGDCEQCIEFEINSLALIESVLWRRAAGDITRYLNFMHDWLDQFNKTGLPW